MAGNDIDSLANAHFVVAHRSIVASAPNPDSFLSAMASVSGTIAAILGGFVLAALISLASERTSLAALVRERHRALQEAETRLSRQQQAHDLSFRMLLRRWLRVAYGQVEQLPDTDAIVGRLSRLGIAVTEVVRQHVEQFSSDWNAANDCMLASRDQLLSHPESRTWANWIAHSPTKGLDVELLRDAFDRVVDSISRTEALRSTSPVAQRSRGQHHSSDLDPLLAADLALRQWSDGPELASVTRSQEQIEHARQLLAESEQELVSRRLPPYLLYGMALFVFMVGVGVVYPLMLMPAQPKALSSASDLVLRGGLIGQSAAIVLYMGLLVHAIRAGDHRAIGD